MSRLHEPEVLPGVRCTLQHTGEAGAGRIGLEILAFLLSPVALQPETPHLTFPAYPSVEITVPPLTVLEMK